MEGATLVLETLLESGLVGCVDGLLAQLHDQIGVGADLLSQLDCLANQLISGNHLAGQTQLLRLLGGDHVTGEAHLHGLGLANDAGQTLSATGSGNGAQRNLGLTELGLIAGIDDVAHHGQLAATAQSVSINGSNDGLLGAGHLGPVVEEVALDALRVGVGQHLLDISSSSECLLASSQNDGSNALILAKSLQGGGQLLHQAIAKGVQSLGAVQRDDSHVLALASNFSLDELPVTSCGGGKEMAL